MISSFSPFLTRRRKKYLGRIECLMFTSVKDLCRKVSSVMLEFLIQTIFTFPGCVKWLYKGESHSKKFSNLHKFLPTNFLHIHILSTDFQNNRKWFVKPFCFFVLF